MKFINRIGLLTLAFLLGSVVALAQGSVNGTYEGMVKMPNGPEQKLSLELKSEGAKVTGRAKHGDKSIEITDGKLENGTITLVFDAKDHTFVGKVDGDKITGEAGDGAQKIPLELKKVNPAATAAPATAAAPAAGAVSINGQWDAVADANGQPFPFLLVLKVDGETVTGSSSSQLGESTVKGTWKDGKLVFVVEGQNGSISMSATVVEGKLSGEYDYSGQLQGKWVAVKKN
ncbi:MAG TPA: hypothetical protein VFI24_04855 [Pyrinomonadaceae bacterium]|nr:hypothetical protein [Pyrinomonadaceae bacterium]